MSNIEKIKAEIEKRRELIKAYCLNPNHDKRYDVVPEQLAYILSFIDSLPEEKPSEDLKEENRKTMDAEVILNGHGLLVDVTKWADGYKLKVIIKEN